MITNALWRAIAEGQGWVSPSMLEDLLQKLNDNICWKMRHVGVFSMTNLATIGGPSKHSRYVQVADGMMCLEDFMKIMISESMTELFKKVKV